MKKLITQIDTLAKDQAFGLAESSPDLSFNASPLYIYRSDSASLRQVALVSGGGSGHEPLHSGFVGKGMLTAACPGEIFTSPTPDQIYQCVKQLNTDQGVLLIIKNYTGDVLNFETAIELLSADDISVGCVLIDDDIAVKDSLYTAGRRGVAGTVLVEKILGAAADKGFSLNHLEVLGQKVNNCTRSIGAALSPCTVPAIGTPSFSLNDNEVEFGVGIHGEPGIERRPYNNSSQLVSEMFNELIESAPYTRQIRTWNRNTRDWQELTQTTESLQQGDNIIVLINGLGSTPVSELYGAFSEVKNSCSRANLKIVHSLIGSYCTSLDMTGLSITLLKVDKEMIQLWHHPVNTPALRWGC